MVLAALALLPLGPWARLADPDWGLVVVTGLLAMSPLPMALMAPAGRRHGELAETVGAGIVLMLAAGSMMLVGGTARTGELVALQDDTAWGLMLSPLGFLLVLVLMTWESDRFHRLRLTGTAAETWPGPHRAMGMYTVTARLLALGLLGSLLFLGGWAGPFAEGMWWTMTKALVLVAFTSMFAGSLPLERPATRASRVRTRWLPLATANLVLVAAVLEVMA
jgi:NADH-quinone oxidoreductase subunit H